MVIAGIPFTMPAVWIGLIVIFLVIEGLTAGLVTIWFSVGCTRRAHCRHVPRAAVAAARVVFVISIAAFAVTRPLVKKMTSTAAHSRPTPICSSGRNVSSLRTSTI